jgi:hypothetical protein
MLHLGEKMTGQEIADAVNKILKEAATHKKDFESDSINWGDLKCNEVREVTTIYPYEEVSREIVIDEASPDSFHLPWYVHEQLKNLYDLDCAVRTEW